MSFRTDLYSQLSTYAGLTALVGKRIYPPNKVPENAVWPYCVYFIVSRVRRYSHQGFSNLERYRVQVSTFAKDIDGGAGGYSQADDINEQVIAAMEAWPASNGKVQACQQDDEQDQDDGTVQLQYSHIPSDFIVLYG